MSDKLLTRTQGGEKAWRSLPLPPAERRMLGLVRAPLPEHAVKVLIGQDPLLSVMLGRGWLKWEEGKGEDDPPSSVLPLTPSSQEGSEALKRIHERFEEKRRQEEEELVFKKEEDGILKEQDLLSLNKDDKAGENERESIELDTYSDISVALQEEKEEGKKEEERIDLILSSPLSIQVQHWIEDTPSQDEKVIKDTEKEDKARSHRTVTEEEKEESLRLFLEMMSGGSKN